MSRDARLVREVTICSGEAGGETFAAGTAVEIVSKLDDETYIVRIKTSPKGSMMIALSTDEFERLA